jgi:hypothetical protein
VTYLPLVGVGSGLPDDTIYPTASQGLIFFADTGGDTVYKVYASGMAPDTTLIDVGNEFGILNTTTGVVTPIATGFSLVSPHGADFVTFQAAGVPEPASEYSAGAGLLLLGGAAWAARKRRGWTGSISGKCNVAPSRFDDNKQSQFIPNGLTGLKSPTKICNNLG